MTDYDTPDEDPIVAEVRATRAVLAMRFNGDLTALFEFARQRTEQHAREGHPVLEPLTTDHPSPLPNRKAS